MRIGELATASGIPAKTIRFWEARGLLPEPDRTPSGYRDYESGIIERLCFIRTAQTSGLTLRQIGQILDISDGGQPPCHHVAGLIDQRLADVEAHIGDLIATRAHLRRLAGRAAEQDPGACDGYCTIIAGSEVSE